MNDRLSVRHSKDFANKTEVTARDDSSAYDANQPNNAIKPVMTDISSKVEADLQTERYTVAPENKAKSFPDAVKPGECYGELVYPATFEKREERIETNPQYSEIEVTPAKYEWVEKKVLKKEAETRLEIVPATYKTVEEQVMVEPKRTVTETIPASFRTEERKVLVQPATRKWVDGNADVENKIDTNMTGDVVCLVETPAKYKTVSVKVIDQPARTETRTIPAEYKTVKRTVVDVPAHTREVEVPAEYATVKVRKLVEDERIERNSVDPQYTSVTRYVETEPAYTKWERVLCEESIKPALAFEIEKGLKSKGYNPGPIDGTIDDQTDEAIENYQMDQGLAKGAITPHTLRSLGIVDFNDARQYEMSSM